VRSLSFVIYCLILADDFYFYLILILHGITHAQSMNQVRYNYEKFIRYALYFNWILSFFCNVYAI